MDLYLILLWTLIVLVFGFLRIRFSYWENKGVPQVKTHFLWGCIAKLKTMHHTEIVQEAYDSFKSKSKLAGIYLFSKPAAVILDMDLIKSVLIKDFNKFTSRRVYKNDKDILSQHLFNLEGDLWKPLRTKISPAFTSGKMKFMFPSIIKVSQELGETYEEQLKESNVLNIYDLNARFTIDVIGTTAFGIRCNSLKDSNAEFRQISLELFGKKDFNIRWLLFKQTYSTLTEFLGLKKFPQRVEEFFMRIVRETVMEREKQGIYRNDFVDVLLELKKSEKISLSYDQIAAQMFLFFIAGYETSSTTMSNALFELGRNPKVQDKVRQEILDTLKRCNNELTYEGMMEMKYLDQVITETLRMYPPLRFLERHAVEDYTVPDTNIVIEKGTNILIPVRSIHYDPAIYDNPMEFRPERFTPSEEATRHPQSFLGFGEGPRNCIGLRFGRMQTRIGLVTLLSKFRFSHSSKTDKEMQFSKYSVIVVPKDQVWLKVEKLDA